MILFCTYILGMLIMERSVTIQGNISPIDAAGWVVTITIVLWPLYLLYILLTTWRH